MSKAPNDRTGQGLRVLRAQSGDREALEQLLRGVQPALFRYLLRMTGNHATTEEVLQEVLMRVYRKLRYLREPEVWQHWCYRIATREAMRRLRLDRRWGAQDLDGGEIPDLEAPPPAAPEQRELAERAAAMLDQLPPASRAVLALHYTEQLSLDEVAAVLGIPAGTVKSRLAYGLNVLRRQLRGSDKS